MMLNFHYMLFMLPAMALAGLATLLTQGTFHRYSRVRSQFGLTGAEAAARMLAEQGLRDVRIEPVHGFLSDHYDPTSRTLRLSPEVYGSTSLAAIGVACHEAGHALQHASRYAPLMLRTGLVPLTQIGSHAAYLLFVLGAVTNAMGLMQLGAILFAVAVLFAVVTLPVEWDASARARRLMVSSGVVTAAEGAAAGKVLNAAFLTYVAAAFTALLNLLYFLMRAGLLGGRDRD